MQRKILLAGLVAMYAPFLTGSARAEGAKGSVELMAGNETATLDTKLLVPLAERFSFLNRNRVPIDYEGNVKPTFHIAKFSYRMLENLGITTGVMGTSVGGINPQIGLEHLSKAGRLQVYQLFLVSTQENPILTSITNLAYRPQLVGDLSLMLELENVSFFSGQSHGISLQRPRVGIDYKNFQVGLAADLTEIGRKWEFGYQLGGFARTNF